MEKTFEKSYEKLISYVKEGILAKRLEIGDKLPSERDLAAELEISRNSVREGIKILERIGVISSHHGAGNYITSQFDQTITEVLSMMYVLKGMNTEEITEFRFGLEYAAISLAVRKIDDNGKERLLHQLEAMESAETEAIRAKNDKIMHYLLVEFSENGYIISTYNALNYIMEKYVPEMREKIFIGMKTEESLALAHRELIEGVVEGDEAKALRGLFDHFRYIRQYMGNNC